MSAAPGRPEAGCEGTPTDRYPLGAGFADAADARRFAEVPLADRLEAGDLPGLIALAAARHGTARAIRFLPSGLPGDVPQDLGFDALLDNMRAAMGVLQGLGVTAGDRVALLLPNHPLGVSAVLAAQAVGVAAPLNPYLEAAEIAALLTATGARVLVADGPLATDKLAAVLQACPQPPRVLSLSALHEGLAADAPPLRDRRAETVALFHTGGTTGLPKLVPLSGLNFAASALVTAYAYGYGPADTVLAAMPMFHVGGLLASTLFPLACGAGIVLAGEQGYRGKGVVAAVWTLARQERLSVLIGPPTVMGQLAQALPARGQLPRLRLLVNGAAALPVAIGRQLVDALQVPLTEPWGLTEATLAVTSMPHGDTTHGGSVGVALPYCRVKAVRVDAQDQATGDCEAGEIGVLAIQGPTVFGGYLGLPPQRQPWLGDGWLHTGDLGRVDADGHVWITGRSKDLIKRGGHGIDPTVIESALYAHPDVALAAAVGCPDAYAGELPVAYVQARPGRALDAPALLALAAQTMTERAAVPKEIFVLPAIPLTGIGKIDKQALRLDAAQRVLARLLRGVDGLNGRFALAVTPHAQFGTLVRAEVPAAHVAAVRALLDQFALHAEVSASPHPQDIRTP